MKNFISYTVTVLLSFLIFSGFLFNNVKKSTQNIFNVKDSTKIKKDTSSNKLPEGYSFITNYTFSKQKKIQSVCTDSTGTMVFADNTGVTFFDGETEKNIKIEDSPNEIVKDKKFNRFYIACSRGCGYISKNKSGEFAFQTLSENAYNKKSYKHVIINGNNILFSGNNTITEYNPKTNKISDIYNNPSQTITGIIILNNELYVNISGIGLQIIKSEKISSVINDSLFSSSDILFAVPYKKNVIIGLSNSKLYLFDGNNYSPYTNNAAEYIEESIINNGKDVNSEQFVITTLNGGAVLLKKKTGEILNTYNYRTGLPDDEIYTAGTDLSGGLWLAHEYGISRIASDIPVKNFDRFPGLQGSINAVKFYDSTLYVATGEGLYRLSEIKNYEEVEVAENKKIKYLKKVNTSENNTFNIENDTKDLIENKKEENENNDGNFFTRWKNRKKNRKEVSESKEDEKNISENIDVNKAENSAKYKTEYKTITEYKKIYELHSVKYIYKKTEGINSKCKKITDFKSGILISSNSGLFYIKNNKTSVIIPDAYIYNLSCNPNSDVFYVSTSEGLYKIFYSNNDFNAEKVSGSITEKNILTSLFTVSDSTLWASDNKNIYLLKILGNDILSAEQFKVENDFDEEIIITKNKGTIVFLTNTNAYVYNRKENDLKEDTELTDILSESNHTYLLNDTLFTINSGNKILYKNILIDSLNQLKYAWIFNQIKSLTLDKNKDIWIIAGANEIYKIEHDKINDRTEFNLFLTGIKDFNGNNLPVTSYLKLNSNYKRITIHLSAPGYLKKGFVRFFYGIDVSNKNEYISTENPYFPINELTPGKHILSVYAVNSLNTKSETIKIVIQVTPPFWRTPWFIVAVFSVFMILLSLGISTFYRKKQQKIKEYNEILEKKVKERTAEIEDQNKLIQKQNLEIYNQYQKIEYQNKETTESIKYAGIIQKAALSETGIYSKYISDFFILFMPRDIVSGDFYWISEAQNKLLIAAVDCTGHGVPGGFLSMLGISFLNEIVKEISKEKKDILAADILTELREKIITTLSSHDEERKDGMDMSLAVINKEDMQLNYAGAYNPAYVIRNNMITKIDADRMPVGSNKKFNNIPFKNKYIKLQKDDRIYLFSDGYADQFGGKYQKKFNSRRFREMLLHIHKLPGKDQETAANKILHKWMGDNDQVDDILLIGIKV